MRDIGSLEDMTYRSLCSQGDHKVVARRREVRVPSRYRRDARHSAEEKKVSSKNLLPLLHAPSQNQNSPNLKKKKKKKKTKVPGRLHVKTHKRIYGFLACSYT